MEHGIPCANPRDRGDMPNEVFFLPAGLTQIRTQQLLQEFPPYHVTQDDISAPLQSLEVEKITGHQSVRGRREVIVVVYETHRTGLSRPSWEEK